MTFKPIRDHILVRPKRTEDKATGEPVVTSVADQQSQSGTIVSAGNGSPADDGMTHPLDVKVGDKIVFAEGAGTEVALRGESLIVLKESDVIGTL